MKDRRRLDLLPQGESPGVADSTLRVVRRQREQARERVLADLVAALEGLRREVAALRGELAKLMRELRR